MLNMLIELSVKLFDYVTTVWEPVAVLLFLAVIGAFLIIMKLYNEKQGTLSKRMDTLETEVAECHVERDNLWKKVKGLEADNRQKDTVIDGLKKTVDRLEAKTRHLQELLNNLLEKMVDDKVRERDEQ